MNAVAMNPIAAGGPVGGGMMMMNNGSPAVSAGNNTHDSLRLLLNTYIYEYLLKHGHYDIARTMVRDDRFEVKTGPKQSPSRRKDGDMNGDGDLMDMDGKDDIPEDIPRPSTWEPGSGNGFLFEWYSIFQDLFYAHRTNGQKLNGANLNPVAQYLFQHHNMQRLRENQQNQNLGRTGMVNQAMMQRMQQNGMMSADAQRAMAAGKMTTQQMQQMQNRKAQMMQQMQGRDQPEGEMNGVRPGTPTEGDAGGSPSKRPRIDNGQQQFTNGMMPNGRPAGMPGAANQGMILQTGFPNPQMNPQFPRNGNMPPKGMQAGMANGMMMNMGNAGSPMMQANQFPEGMQMDYRNAMQPGQPMQPGGGGPQSGNHALQDYQMQLMLLEQQNKKRLMMARQEQHENNPGGPMPGVNMSAPGMSPGGSRGGTSPNPGDQMKRTPGLGALPGSPSAGDAMQGRSPAAMGFMNGMQGPDFNGAMFMGGKDQPMMSAGGPGMRPPTSADMNGMRQQGGRVNPQFQGSQPMQQQVSQGGQQQAMGTPGQRNDMPPPQAPAGGSSAQRNQGTSPSGGNAPPTPSQSNKANPKTKKGAKNEDNKKRPTKKNSAANAPTADDNLPATSTPSTPITSNNPGVMNNAVKGQAGMQPGAQPPPQTMQMNNQQMPHTDLGQNNQFGDYGQDQDFNLDFSTLENADVLENFDFDSFLNTSADDTFNFNAGIDVGADFNMNQTE